MNIIYRCCNAEVDDSPIRPWLRPPWFSKLNCWRSFEASLNHGLARIDKIIVVHDGPPGSLLALIRDSKIPNIEIKEVDYCSNEGSLLETFDVADQLDNDSSIYFLEDDYLHLPDSVYRIAGAVEKFGLVTGYDHPDRITRDDDITKGQDFIDICEDRHWRTAESTTCTWACSREMWGKIRCYARQYKLQDRELFRALIRDNVARLWTPIPGLTNHVGFYPTPLVDWEEVNSAFSSSIQ